MRKDVPDEYTRCTIIDMSNKVLEHIERNYEYRQGRSEICHGWKDIGV